MEQITDSQVRSKRGLWVAIAVAVVIVTFFEVGLFNLGHWRTTGLQQAVVGEPVIGRGLKSLGNNEYEITDPETATVTVPVSARDGGGPVRVESVRVQATPNNRNNTEYQQNRYVDGAIELRTTGGRTMSGNEWVSSRDSDGVWGDPRNELHYTTNPSSQYLLIGKKLQYYDSTEIRVRFYGDKGHKVIFDRVYANPTIPFEINPFRLLLEIAIAAFFVVFRPRSAIYRLHVNLHSNRQRSATTVYVVAWSALIVAVAALTMPRPWGYDAGTGHYVDHEQYQRLADALIHGHTWLDLPVDPVLQTMANPYDFFARRGLAASDGHQFIWDHAYFNGRYYCYFGVVPALLTFVPYQLITGHWMPTWVAMGIFSALAVVFGTLLVRRLAHDYFPKASLGVVWLVIIGFNIGTNLFVYNMSCNFYGVPIVCAIALVLMGLWFWQVSKRHDGSVNGRLIGAGSLCMALLLGSRPRFSAAWLLAFPLFWEQITQHRTLFSKRGAWGTAAALLPFVLVTVPLLYYNHIRFGAWLNFGQNYNFTGFDLTTRRSPLYILPGQVFNQLFEPVATTMRFPFITTVDTTLAAPNEPSIGGYFAVYPLALFALLFILLRYQLRDHKVWGLACTMMTVGFIVAVFDCYKGGTTMRYSGDYAFYFMLATLLVVLAFDSGIQQGAIESEGLDLAKSHEVPFAVRDSLGFRTLVTLLVALVFFTMLINLFGLFAKGRLAEFASVRTGMYTTVRNWFIGMTA